MSSRLRIAYFANYGGAGLHARRPGAHDSLACSQKVETVAKLLSGAGHDVVIFSRGVRNGGPLRLDRAFRDTVGPSGPVVQYGTTFGRTLLNICASTWSLGRTLRAEHARCKFEVVLLYNVGFPESALALWLNRYSHVPLVLEYEDAVECRADGTRGLKNRLWASQLNRVRSSMSGMMAVSPQLLSTFECGDKLLLRGVLADDLLGIQERCSPEVPKVFLYAGSMNAAKGVGNLCEGWQSLNRPDLELRLFGDGPDLPRLRSAFEGERIRFYGRVARSELVANYAEAAVFVNPHTMAAQTSGQVFPFKMIEYLGCGRPVVSTPIHGLEPELAPAITWCASDAPRDIGHGLAELLRNYGTQRVCARDVRDVVWSQYGSRSLIQKLDRFVRHVSASNRCLR